MALAVRTIAENIAALSVSGVTIHDLDDLKGEYLERDLPVLIPNPEGYVANVLVERDSYGSSEAKQHITYDLTYRYLHARVGSGRGLFDQYPQMVTNTGLILDRLIASDALSNQIDFRVVNVSAFGPVQDPSGNLYHGCDIIVNVMEFIN